MKILTVDDSRTIRLLVRKALDPLNLEIVEAENGQEAIKVAADERPDLIILDVTMPVMDGQEALRKLRSTPSTQNIPVLMLTAEAEKGLVTSLVQLGISGYILKPFQADQLVAKLNSLLDLSGTDGGEAGSAESGQADGELPAVLMLDDKETVLTSAHSFLSDMVTVHTTGDASQAIDLARRYSPEIVFLDLVVPNVNVFEVFSMMRAEARLESTRFVAVAIRTMTDEVIRARRAGFHDLLMKPFNQESIRRVTRRNLRGADTVLTYGEGYATFKYPSYADYEGISEIAFSQQTVSKAFQALDDLADGGYLNLFLDLTEVTQKDSSIMNSVNSIQEKAHGLGINLNIIVPDKSLAQALGDLSETSGRPLFKSLEEALSSISGERVA